MIDLQIAQVEQLGPESRIQYLQRIPSLA